MHSTAQLGCSPELSKHKDEHLLCRQTLPWQVEGRPRAWPTDPAARWLVRSRKLHLACIAHLHTGAREMSGSFQHHRRKAGSTARLTAHMHKNGLAQQQHQQHQQWQQHEQSVLTRRQPACARCADRSCGPVCVCHNQCSAC